MTLFETFLSEAANRLKPDDYLGFGAVASFGLWFVLFPRNVIAFYTLFHGGQVKMPDQFGVRLSGSIWLALVFFVFVHYVIFGK